MKVFSIGWNKDKLFKGRSVRVYYILVMHIPVVLELSVVLLRLYSDFPVVAELCEDVLLMALV